MAFAYLTPNHLFFSWAEHFAKLIFFYAPLLIIFSVSFQAYPEYLITYLIVKPEPTSEEVAE
jgi:hypothetical protein